jgi:hypothetical protein
MARLAFLACAVLALAACGGDESSSPEAPGTTTAQTDTSTERTKGSLPPPAEISGDGRYFGYVRGAKSEPHVILFDVAQTFSGEAADRAAAEDGAVPPGEPVPNDHYERNPEQDVEQLKLASDASITAAWPAGFLTGYVTREARAKCEKGAGPMPCTEVPLSLQSFFKAMKGLSADRGIPVWVTVREGIVERVDEQYFP